MKYNRDMEDQGNFLPTSILIFSPILLRWQKAWGMVFLLSGVFSAGVVLWPFRPHFLLRVLARMLTAFCMLSFAMNNLANDPPPASAFFYSVMALFAIWAVIRTRCDG